MDVPSLMSMGPYDHLTGGAQPIENHCPLFGFCCNTQFPNIFLFTVAFTQDHRRGITATTEDPEFRNPDRPMGSTLTHGGSEGKQVESRVCLPQNMRRNAGPEQELGSFVGEVVAVAVQQAVRQHRVPGCNPFQKLLEHLLGDVGDSQLHHFQGSSERAATCCNGVDVRPKEVLLSEQAYAGVPDPIPPQSWFQIIRKP